MLDSEVRHIHNVVGIDMNSARAAELVPAFQVVAVLIEYLNAVIVAIAHEQPALGGRSPGHEGSRTGCSRTLQSRGSPIP